MIGCNPATTSVNTIKPLIQVIGQVFIIAHREPTHQLELVLAKEGFRFQTLRQAFQPEHNTYSRSYLCLLNHRQAWEKIAQSHQPCLILEADFVPVVGFGQLPLPFDSTKTDTGVAWLYTCAPQVYSVSEEGYAEGFSASTVAYIVTPQAAKALIHLADTVQHQVGPTNYSAWDSQIDTFLRQQQLRNYIPFRNYGEHGGLPNPEHRKNGLSSSHRADTLYNRLAFQPLYAVADQGGNWAFFRTRMHARLKGLARLLMGRFVRPAVLQGSSVPMRLVSFAIRRQIVL